jgi:hypothetical protein
MVSILTGYGPDKRGVGVRVPTGSRVFLFSTSSRLSLSPTQLTTWNIIKAESGKNRLNDKNCNTMKINSNIFNSHILYTADNIIQKISAQITSNIDNNSNYKHYLNLTAKSPFPNINFNKITTKEIETVLSSLSSKNSSRYDEISMKTLQINAPYISSLLCSIFNKAVLSGNFHLRMKYLTVTPIYKKGDRKNCVN